MFFAAPKVTSDTWHSFGGLALSHVSNGEQVKHKFKWDPMCDMCHHLIGRKSKVMDKRIRKSKGANRRVTCGKMRPPT